MGYHWPGNLRELSHLIERGVLLCSEGLIDVDDLNIAAKAAKSAGNKQGQDGCIEMPFMTLEQAEVKLIAMALRKPTNNVPKAADLLGLTKSSLYRGWKSMSASRTDSLERALTLALLLPCVVGGCGSGGVAGYAGGARVAAGFCRTGVTGAVWLAGQASLQKGDGHLQPTGFASECRSTGGLQPVVQAVI